MKNTLIAAAMAAAVVAGGAAKEANAAVQTALWLSIDVSGSISNANFALQRDAYVNVLGGLTDDGTVAIGVNSFDGGIYDIFSLRVIDSAQDRQDLVDAIAGMAHPAGLTDIAGAISDGAAKLSAGVDCTTVTCLIDVSTDGAQTVSGNPDTAAQNAVNASGIKAVNCLGVGGDANCGFIFGDDSFSVSASTFADFEGALTTKLAREGVIDPNPVPLPMPVMMLASGFVALFGLRRRRAAA